MTNGQRANARWLLVTAPTGAVTPHLGSWINRGTKPNSKLKQQRRPLPPFLKKDPNSFD